MMRWRWWVWLVAIAPLVLLADAAVWYAAQRSLARGFADWRTAAAAQGVVVSAGPAELGGFPFAATRSFGAAVSSGPAVMRSSRVVLGVSPTRPGTVRVRLPAPVDVIVTGLPPMTLTSPDWRLDARLDGSGIVASDARGLDIAVIGAAGAARHAQAALAHLQGQPSGGALDLVGSAQSITLPEPRAGETWPLGRHLASIAFEAVLQGGLPWPSRAGAAPDRTALAAWRKGGGMLALRRLALGYGPLGVSGQARLMLDARLQPAGTAAIRVLGYAETLDALMAAHVITAHVAQAVSAVLSLLARPPEGGGAPAVALDLVLRDRTLTAAGFPLLRLPDLAWPGG